MRARVLVFETEGHLRKNRPANTDTWVNVFWLCPGNVVTLGSLNAVGLDDNYPSQAASISFPVGKGVKDKVKGLMPAGLIRSLAGTLPVLAQFGINAPLGHKQRANEKESSCRGHRLLLSKKPGNDCPVFVLTDPSLLIPSAPDRSHTGIQTSL